MKNTVWKYYHATPNDLNYAVSDVYELSVLTYLIQLSSDYDVVHPNQTTLKEKCMVSNGKLNMALKALESCGYITRKPSSIEKATEYIVNYDTIQSAIISNTPIKETGEKARREISEVAKDHMAKRRVLKSPELTNDVIRIAEYAKVNRCTGEIINE